MKRLLSILTALLAAVVLSAQPKLLKEEFYLGAQGGVMASMVYFSPTVSQNPLHCYLGPTAGLVFRYIGHKVCGLQVEVNYMQRGWQEYYKSTGNGYRRQLDYIEIPLLTHLYFGKKGARGYLNLGPQVGYLVHEGQSNVPTEGVTFWDSGEGSGTYHEYVPAENRFDWGVAAELGFYYRSKVAGAYQLGVRFNYSLGSIFSTSKMDYFSASNNMNLSLSLAYMWEFKRKK